MCRKHSIYLFSFIFAFAQWVCHPITTYSRNSFHISSVKTCSYIRMIWSLSHKKLWHHTYKHEFWCWLIRTNQTLIFKYARSTFVFFHFEKKKKIMRRLKWIFLFFFIVFQRFSTLNNVKKKRESFPIKRPSSETVLNALHYQYWILIKLFDCQIIIWVYNERFLTKTVHGWFTNI